MFVIIDVCGTQGTVALDDASGNRRHVELTGRKHSETLAPTMAELLRDRPDRLEGIGVVTGPGTFTGIRVGISFAMGLAAAADTPLYGQSKFDLLLHLVAPRTWPVHLVIPAGRDRVFLATCTSAAALPEIQMLRVNELDPQLSYIASQPIPHHDVTLCDRDPIDAFLDRIMDGTLESTPFPQPLYVRPPDVRNPNLLLKNLLEHNRPPPKNGQRGDPFVGPDGGTTAS